MIDNYLLLIVTLMLCLGAFLGGMVGPHICSRSNHRILRIGIAVFGMVSGIWLLWVILWKG